MTDDSLDDEEDCPSSSSAADVLFDGELESDAWIGHGSPLNHHHRQWKIDRFTLRGSILTSEGGFELDLWRAAEIEAASLLQDGASSSFVACSNEIIVKVADAAHMPLYGRKGKGRRKLGSPLRLLARWRRTKGGRALDASPVAVRFRSASPNSLAFLLAKMRGCVVKDSESVRARQKSNDLDSPLLLEWRVAVESPSGDENAIGGEGRKRRGSDAVLRIDDTDDDAVSFEIFAVIKDGEVLRGNVKGVEVSPKGDENGTLRGTAVIFVKDSRENKELAFVNLTLRPLPTMAHSKLLPFLPFGMRACAAILLACAATALYFDDQTHVLGFLGALLFLFAIIGKEAPFFKRMLGNPSKLFKAHVELDALKQCESSSAESASSPLISNGAKFTDASITDKELALIAALRNRFLPWLEPPPPKGAPRSSLTPDEEELRRVYRLHVGCDYRLVRFLRARSMNLRKAEAMVKKSMQWRAEYKATDLLHSFLPPDWLMNYAGAPLIVDLIRRGLHVDRRSWYFRDKDDHLSIIFRAGVIDWRRIYKKMKCDGDFLVRCALWGLEMLREDLEKLHEETRGKISSYVTLVFDLEGFALSKQIPLSQTIPLARKIFSVIGTSYPELIRKIVVINAPFLFNTIWKVFVPFLPAELLEKIHIHGHGKKTIRRAVQDVMGPGNAPAFLGGSVRDKAIDGDGDDDFCRLRIPPFGPFEENEGIDMIT